MLKNYWLVAIRKLWKHKAHAVINVLGLTVGLASCLIIFLITHFELGFDRFHPGGDRIYRLVNRHNGNNIRGLHFGAAIPGPLAPTMQKELSGCTVSAFITSSPTIIVPSGDSRQPAKQFESTPRDEAAPVIITDPQYFRIFQYKWLAGNSATALNDPYRVVLSTKEVRQFFGNISPADAMGREVIYVDNDTIPAYVSGVVADWDQNTDFAFRDFISYSTVQTAAISKDYHLDNWRMTGSSTQGIVLLDKGTTVAQVERQFPGILQKYVPAPRGPRAMLAGPNAMPAGPNVIPAGPKHTPPPRPKNVLTLQPLADIHFNEDYTDDYSRQAHLPTLYGLMGIAVFILLLAVINFVNLSTAQSLQRTKEVGIRKVLGSRRKHIVFQFLGETLVLTLLAAILSLLITPLVMRLLDPYMPPGLRFEPSIVTLLFLAGITIVTALLGGWYPAKVISALLPVLSLKGQATRDLQPNRFLHRGLIVFQFTISLLFIIGTVVVARQLHYVLNTDLGFDKDAIITFDTDGQFESGEVLAQQLGEIPGIALVSRNENTPQAIFHGLGPFIYRGPQNDTVMAGSIHTDTNYLRLFGIPLVAGRNFVANDSVYEYVINETMARQLGFRRPQDAINQPVDYGMGRLPSPGSLMAPGPFKGMIVGVVRDFHSTSLHEAISPICLYYDPRVYEISIRLAPVARRPEAAAAVLARVQKVWQANYPHDKFSYTFFDDKIASLYQQEQRISGLMRLAMIIAIAISCMGLLGLATFAAEQRQKEIGIRKVMGATVLRIFRMLTVDFLWPVVLAFVIATPLAWYFLHEWLQGFVYRATVPWWIFGCCGLGAVIIALVTVSFQVLRTAKVNPAEALRTD
jgi:putative ABC transport system permease protein